MLSNYDKQRLGEYLGEQADVLAAFLFGSVARGADRPDSDLDIAVLLEHAEEITPLRAATLLSEVMAIAGRDDVDLVILNSATPPAEAPYRPGWRGAVRPEQHRCCRVRHPRDELVR